MILIISRNIFWVNSLFLRRLCSCLTITNYLACISLHHSHQLHLCNLQLLAPCKRIHEGPGFRIPASRFRIPASGFWISTFWIPDSKPLWIPDSSLWIPDSNSKNLLDSGFSYMGRNFIKGRFLLHRIFTSFSSEALGNSSTTTLTCFCFNYLYLSLRWSSFVVCLQLLYHLYYWTPLTLPLCRFVQRDTHPNAALCPVLVHPHGSSHSGYGFAFPEQAAWLAVSWDHFEWVICRSQHFLTLFFLGKV